MFHALTFFRIIKILLLAMVFKVDHGDLFRVATHAAFRGRLEQNPSRCCAPLLSPHWWTAAVGLPPHSATRMATDIVLWQPWTAHANEVAREPVVAAALGYGWAEASTARCCSGVRQGLRCCSSEWHSSGSLACITRYADLRAKGWGVSATMPVGYMCGAPYEVLPDFYWCWQ